MKVAHHAALVGFAARLAPRVLPDVATFLSNSTTRAALVAGVQAADYYDDVRIGGDSPAARFVRWTQEHVSGGTSLQHFGVERGYRLDADEWRPRIVDLTASDSAVVDYRVDVLPMPASAAKDAPGRAVHGKPWAHVFFPPAAELSDFYARVARLLRRAGLRERSLRCLAAAIHLLQDLCVPHHVIGTIGLGHSQFEAALLTTWRELESGSWPRAHLLSWRAVDPATLTADYLDTLALPPTVRELAGRVAIETRRLWVIPDHPTPIRSLTGGRAALARVARSCCLASAATLRLVADFAG